METIQLGDLMQVIFIGFCLLGVLGMAGLKWVIR